MVTIGRQKKSHGRGRINRVAGQLTRVYGKEGKKSKMDEGCQRWAVSSHGDTGGRVDPRRKMITCRLWEISGTSKVEVSVRQSHM